MDAKTQIMNFGMVLAAMGKCIDEEGLSNEEALARIKAMMEPGKQPPEVMASLRLLEGIDDELEFRLLVGSESLRAYGLLEGE